MKPSLLPSPPDNSNAHTVGPRPNFPASPQPERPPETRRTQLAKRTLLFLDQRWVHFFLIALVMSLLATFLHTSHWRWADLINKVMQDRYFVLRPTRPPEDVAQRLPHTRDFVMVETTHEIPRPVLARLLHQLRYARVVALDLMFVDHHAQLDEDEVELYRPQMQQWNRDLEVLAKAVRANNVVVMGTWPEQDRDAATGQYNAQPLWERPPASLWDAARYRAHLLVDPDGQDEIVRRVRLFENTTRSAPQSPGKAGQSTTEKTEFPARTPSLGLAVAAMMQGVSQRELGQLRPRNGFLQLGDKRIPVGPDGLMTIDYLGGRECFEYDSNHAPYTRVLDFYEPEEFRGKIVFVGESSFKSKEIFKTPFGDMPGMQLHAHIAATLLSPQGPPTELPLPFSFLAALCCSLMLAAPLIRWSLWSSFLVAAL
ncbi:MAG TPA: CHASE2 domain-containing protein, partial [Abditibacteriaceae bacterium]